MTETYKFYNLFSPEGKLVQTEYALECLSSAHPFIVVHCKGKIVIVSKKKICDKLAFPVSSTFKINKNTYGTITGLPGDVDQVKARIKNISTTKEYNLGFEPTADLICRAYADKTQKLIQSTGIRIYGFGMAVFGFENNETLLYYTDSSAVCVPYFAIGVGQNSNKINGFLEKNINKIEDVFEYAIEGMCQALGYDFGPNDIEVCWIEKDKEMTWLDNSEIDDILVRISEKN